jgi:hypothetical protein
VEGVDWEVTMVKGLVMGEQGEWTDRVMRCDLLGEKVENDVMG